MAATRIAAPYLARLAAVRARLARHARTGAHAGLTGADPATGERWEAGQVWAHLAEFQGYWVDQLRGLLVARAAGVPEPIPFGRTKADPQRAAAIERDRGQAPAELHARVERDAAATEAFVRDLATDEWRAVGLHPTLGPMPLPTVVDRFLVGHLEEHADQLDELASRPRS